MKVNDLNAKGVGAAGSGKSAEIEKASAGSTPTVAAGHTQPAVDHVQLSALSSHIQSTDANSPERAAHLEKLRTEVEAGKYEVDEKAVSRGIVSDLLRGDVKG